MTGILSSSQAVPLVQNKDLRMRSLTLRFIDPVVESTFFQKYLTESQGMYIRTFAAAYAIFSLAGILEYIAIQEEYTMVLALRFLTLVIATLGIYFIKKKQIHISTWINIFTALVSVALSSGATGFSYTYIYYPHLIVISVFSMTLFPLRYYVNGGIIFFGSFLYHLAFILSSGFQPKIFAISAILSFLISALTVVSGYVRERSIRQEFSYAQMLIKEKERSEAANKAKTEFLAVMSHELRTPLNAIIGFSEMIKNQTLGSIKEPKVLQKYIEYAGDIYNSGRYLLSLIQDILDLSRAETGRLILKEDWMNLTEVIDRCGRMFREKSIESGLQLIITIPSSHVNMLGDERLVAQLIINLVGNAIKFTPRGGSIELSLIYDQKYNPGIQVKDTGVGIAPENISRITEPFFQVEGAWRREYTGAGIGLGLVKRILDLHGGWLDVQSQLRKGTTVTAYFPAGRVKKIETSLV